MYNHPSALLRVVLAQPYPSRETRQLVHLSRSPHA